MAKTANTLMAETANTAAGVTYTVRQLRFRAFRFDLHLTPLTDRLVDLTVVVVAAPSGSQSGGPRSLVVRNGECEVKVSVSTNGFGLSELKGGLHS